MSTAPGPTGTGTPAPAPAPVPAPPLPGKRLAFKLIAGTAAIFLGLIIAAILLVSHINVASGGTGSWWGIGTIALLAFALIFLTIMAMVAGLLLRKRRTRRSPTTPPATGTPTPHAPTPKKRWPTWAVFLIAFFVLSVVLRMMVVIKDATQGDSSTGSAATLHFSPPSALCPGTIDLDAGAKNNHAADPKPYADIDPGSKTEVCFGSWVSIPPNWGVWDAEFTNPDPVKDGCIAWLHYQGIDRIIGPFRGTQDIALSNMPARWRIASNCQIVYYKN
ncbi:MAG TPA: hypothetical protein VMA75_04835 [Candidatus Paceibacterota bacterium]|nr:hypothetical protein [Candidatus Paceibacterota bacterium]